jgi:AP-1-like transcription factor
LKAQVERLQVELKEYRKRLSWISSNGIGRSNSLNSGSNKNSNVNSTNDFQFEFPKFGDLPAMSSTNIFNTNAQNQAKRTGSVPNRANSLPKANNNSNARSNSQGQAQRQTTQSPLGSSYTNSPQPINAQQSKDSVDSLSGLFSPSILEATRQASLGGYFPQQNNFNATRSARASVENGTSGHAMYSNSTTSNSDSPGSSTESHNAISSIGTSPEPSLNSPGNKLQEFNLNTISEEQQMNNNFGKDQLCKEISRTCGCYDDPIPPILKENMSNDDSLGFNNANFNANNNLPFDTNNNSWLPNNMGTDFDPVLFGDYREVQDNILSQDFGSFFNDAYPLPDLGSPLHNYSDVAPEQASTGMAPKMDLLKQVEAAKNGTEEVVPDTDKPMTCNKIW